MRVPWGLSLWERERGSGPARATATWVPAQRQSIHRAVNAAPRSRAGLGNEAVRGSDLRSSVWPHGSGSRRGRKDSARQGSPGTAGQSTQPTRPPLWVLLGASEEQGPTSGSWRAPSLSRRPFQASSLLETQGVGGWPAPPTRRTGVRMPLPARATPLRWVPPCQAPEAAASPLPWQQRGQDPRGGRGRPGRSRPQQPGSLTFRRG